MRDSEGNSFTVGSVLYAKKYPQYKIRCIGEIDNVAIFRDLSDYSDYSEYGLDQNSLYKSEWIVEK